MTRKEIFSLILILGLAAAVLAGPVLAQTVAETRALCQTAYDRRYPADAGVDDAGNPIRWDRLQKVVDDARTACSTYDAARLNYAQDSNTAYTPADLKALRDECVAAKNLAISARAIVKADREACEAAILVVSCANDMAIPGECPDGGTPD